MPERGRARCLVEAYVYLDLVAPGGSERASVTDEPGAWLVRADDVEVLVPYAAEEAAGLQGATFGAGVSELLDPGQWVLIGAAYAGRALEAGLFFTADPSSGLEGYDTVVADWSFAADAMEEALKFLPGDAAELPLEAFWTEMGRSVRDAEPGRFSRAQMESDLAFYRQSLDDFRRLHPHWS
ncbi:hypothetical protein GCM10022224_025150 [Nonomuraea antimicrobica]|uniref:SUKH-4 immunity protein n=1 Tax=Nonomuraea antimicrobica TaxID=561173 RepID=A0ABP7BHF1_9ACTN